MRTSLLLVAATVVVMGIAASGGSSDPGPKVPARSQRSARATGHYTVSFAQRSVAPSSGGGATWFGVHYGFAYNEPKLTKAQAIAQVRRWAQSSSIGSPVVRDVTCHQVPAGWSCEYTGQHAWPWWRAH